MTRRPPADSCPKCEANSERIFRWGLEKKEVQDWRCMSCGTLLKEHLASRVETNAA